jgi:hypothetical protein
VIVESGDRGAGHEIAGVEQERGTAAPNRRHARRERHEAAGEPALEPRQRARGVFAVDVVGMEERDPAGRRRYIGGGGGRRPLDRVDEER